MSDHGTHHHDAGHSTEIKSKTAFKSSFWFVVILVGLFIAALNFINVMGHSEGHESHDPHEAAATQPHIGASAAGHEKEEDTAVMHHSEAAASDRRDAAADTAAHEGHH